MAYTDHCSVEEIKKLKVRQMFNTALECALGNEYGT